jgi:hypothetical protein
VVYVTIETVYRYMLYEGKGKRENDGGGGYMGLYLNFCYTQDVILAECSK